MYELYEISPGISFCGFIFNNGLPLRTCKSIELRDILFKTICVPRKYNIPEMEKFWGSILIGFFENIRDSQNKDLIPM